MAGEGDDLLSEFLDFFGELEEWIPGAGTMVGEILLGKVPESSIVSVYALADAWAAVAKQLAEAYSDAEHAADGILENWTGDGAAMQFADQWFKYLESLGSVAESSSAMQQGVQGFGLEVELMKFMVLINLLMLAWALYAIIAASLATFGGSLTGVGPAFAAARAGIAAAWRKGLSTLGNLTIRTALKGVGELVTHGLPNLVKTGLPNLARNMLPKNVIARSVADRMAGKWLASVANKQMLRQLGRTAGKEARVLLARNMAAVRNQLAKEIEQQLARKFGTTLVERGATREATNLAERELFEQLARESLSQFAAKQIAETTFRRELGKYFATRMAFGAGFMGGGNVLGQVLQMTTGHRGWSDFDAGQALTNTLQGAAFGAGMYGSIPGHIIGGGVAGGLVGVGTELVQGGKFDVGNVVHSAAQGAMAGAIFGGQNHLQAMHVPVKGHIGEDVTVMPTERGGLRVEMGGRESGLRMSGSDRGLEFQKFDESGQLESSGLIDQKGKVHDLPESTLTRGDSEVTADAGARPAAQLPAPADAPGRSGGPPGGPGDGGGGPRQPASPTRTAEPVRAGDGPTSTRTAERTPATVEGRTSSPSHAPSPERVLSPERTAPPSSEHAVSPAHDRIAPPSSERTAPPSSEHAAPPSERTAPHPSEERTAPHPSEERTAPREPVRSNERVRGDDPPPPHGPPPPGETVRPSTGESAHPHEARAQDARPSEVRGHDTVTEPRAGRTEHSEAEVTAPPHDGPPPPVAERPESTVESTHPLSSAGAETGEPPTPRSIEHGTVRMEDHPDYTRVVSELGDLGFQMVETTGAPHVVIRHVVDEAGNLIAIEHEVHAQQGMRFLDLEHEIGHVEQMFDRARFPDGPPASEVFIQHPDGSRELVPNASTKLKGWQDPIVEYHVRLQEYIRLAERGVDPGVLEEHARGVDEWGDRYWRKGLKKGFSDSQKAWAEEHFPDIHQLQNRVQELRSAPPAEHGDHAPPSRHDDGPPLAKSSGDTAHDRALDDGQDMSTGGSIRPSNDVQALEWAAEAYDRFRASDADIPDIANNLAEVERPSGRVGFTPEEVGQVKSHLMSEEHLLDDYQGGYESKRFAPDEDIAEAWIRLREGRPLDADLVLLEHELTESNYLRTHPGASYREAHDYANQSYHWAEVAPGRTGEDLNTSWGSERADGDTGGLPEGPGGQSGGRVRLWFSEDGPQVGDREGIPPGEIIGWDGGPAVPEGVHHDSAYVAERGDLAGDGGVRGVGREPGSYDLVPVESTHVERPVELPEDVAAALDHHVQGLLEGQPAHAADQPHAATWNPETRTLTVRYPDGLSVDVALQVNSALPPGHPVVVRPSVTAHDGVWVQDHPAAVVLPAHLPAEAGGRPGVIHEELSNAWQTLHQEMQALPPTHPEPAAPHTTGPPPEALHPLEEAGADVPVLGPEKVNFRDATQTEPAAPPPLTPESVHNALTSSTVPHEVVRWTQDHLAVRNGDGSFVPRSAEEIGATIRNLEREAADAVGDRAAPVREQPAQEVRPPEPRPSDPMGERGPEVRPADSPEPSLAGTTHTASPITDTGFVPNGRHWQLPDVTPREFQDAAWGVPAGDLGGSVVSVRPDGAFVRVETSDGQVHLFRPEVGHRLENVSETAVHAGTARDPHVVQVNDRVAPEQLARTWVHEITETLQVHAAEARHPEPHGVVRRAFAKMGGMFGRAEPEAPRPELPETDPHTSARLAERRFLTREFYAADTAGEQIRLRNEIHGLDRDLARLGQPVHQLEHVPEVNHAGAEPTAEAAPHHDGRDHSTHDEIWDNPRWEQEGRRPSLDELIPSTDEEAAKWETAIRDEFAKQLDGLELAGMRTRLDFSDPYSVSVYRNDVTVRMDIVDTETGSVGRVVRVFHRDYDGSLYVEHNSLKLPASAQGKGFAAEWNRHLEDWYRYSGVDHIEVHASSTVGGYAWAKAGYDWAPNTEHRADAILTRLRGEMRQIDADIEQVRAWANGDHSVDIAGLRQKYGAEDPTQMVAEALRQKDAGQDIVNRAAHNAFGRGDYPTPFDISQAGWNGEHGRDASWIGKRAMLGADWKGVKPISDGGPYLRREVDYAAEPATPPISAIHDLLSGDSLPPDRPITAAEVPDSQFHGYGREVAEPALVEHAGREALDQVVDHLPADTPLRGLHVDIRSVPADSLPDRAVARSVPVDAQGRDLAPGTAPPEGGGYRIELSDRAADITIPRAVTHEIAELSAIHERLANGLELSVPDALRPGEFAEGSQLSPHDMGRLAEVEFLTRLADDPVHGEYARSELNALVDHLGLRPDDPGSSARWAAVENHLSPDAHELLTQLDHAHDASTPLAGIDPNPPENVPHPWPADPVSDYVIRDRDLEFLGLDRDQVEAWMARDAPLGMTPETYREWRISLLEALHQDGISPELVDIRMRGSGADFFSGVHKKLPTEEELAGSPEAQARLREWLGDDPDRPVSRPFDSMYRLGLEEPSDFDLNISSGEMFERARAGWDPAKYSGPLSKDHGYLNKALVETEYPNLYRWKEEWSARTGREMSYAVFDAGGPKDMSHLGFYVHFQDTDWIVHRPGGEPAGPSADGGRE